MIIMIEKFVNLFSILLFGKAYLDGFCEEPIKKDRYQLSTLFPSEEIMRYAEQYIDKSN